MARLPEKVRRTLERMVTRLRVDENVCGLALFGSWGRNEATPSSDVDLLVLDKGNFSYEYVERTESDGLFVDLDHIPKRWVHSIIPPEIDQKLFEMQILYDRDWSLNNTKLLMAKSYSSPERVDIRTEAHIVESDIYLSRATSAFARDDFRSAWLFALVALENILKVLIEIASEPLSNSRFLEKLEVSASKLGKPHLFSEYLNVARLQRVDVSDVRRRLALSELIWHDMKDTVERNPLILEATHFIVKTKLNYFLNPAFLQGMVQRTNFMLDRGKIAEASHYLGNVFLDIVENYVWLKARIVKLKVDYTLLMHSLKRLERKIPHEYDRVLEFFGLEQLDKSEVALAIEKCREIMVNIRGQRKILIKTRLIRE